MSETEKPRASRMPGLTVLGLRARPAAGMLAMLLVIDVLLIAFYVTAVTIGHPGGPNFDLGADRGYGEFVQYSKCVWAIMLLALLALRRRAFVFVAWGLVCAYLLIDDAFFLHENVGWFVRDITPGAPDHAVHLGELGFLVVVGLGLAVVVAVGHVRANRRDRTVSAVLMVLFAALVFFGIVLDAVHHLLFSGPELRALFTTFEDGGELLVLSLITAFVFAVVLCDHEPRLAGRLSVLVDPRDRLRELAPAA